MCKPSRVNGQYLWNVSGGGGLHAVKGAMVNGVRWQAHLYYANTHRHKHIHAECVRENNLMTSIISFCSGVDLRRVRIVLKGDILKCPLSDVNTRRDCQRLNEYINVSTSCKLHGQKSRTQRQRGGPGDRLLVTCPLDRNDGRRAARHCACSVEESVSPHL